LLPHICRDNFLILHALMAAAALCAFPSLRHLPAWDGRGFAVALVAHAAATEPLSYLAHRALHGSSGRLYARYHSLHHSSRVPQPFTAGLATPLEHVALGALMSLPLAAARAAGCASVALAFAYVLAFDSLRAMGHCNVEVVPASLFRAIPALRYVLYTPTYVRALMLSLCLCPLLLSDVPLFTPILYKTMHLCHLADS
jgi:sterol desaturase/sphingolipid hydroxylase (fatty acid hydroxylase superfamily)